MDQAVLEAGPVVLNGWELAAMGLALVLGLILGRASKGGGKGRAAARVPEEKRSPSDDAFMRGISHLMADHTDQAIEEFTRAVTLNSDTVETYVVLGNLFRQKGEIERAVRIRQSIIARPNLNPAAKLQAIYDLGLDYKKGGLFNRAAESFQEVLANDPKNVEGSRQIVALYEEMRDWERAFEALKKLDKLTGEDSRAVLAHYKTERGKELMSGGHLDQAEEAFGQAVSVDKKCLDAYLHLGDLELTRGRPKKAISVWKKGLRLGTDHTHLIISRVAAAADVLGDKVVQSFFQDADLDHADVFTLLALAKSYHDLGQDSQALELLDRAVLLGPKKLNAHRLRGLILLDRGDKERSLAAYSELLGQINGQWDMYQCRQCGFVAPQLTWQCPRCHSWDSMSPRMN